MERSARYQFAAEKEFSGTNTLFWQRGLIVGPGNEPKTLNLQTDGGVITNIPEKAIRSWKKPKTGERMLVAHEGSKHFYPCKVLAPGDAPGTFKIAVDGWSTPVVAKEKSLRRPLNPMKA